VHATPGGLADHAPAIPPVSRFPCGPVARAGPGELAMTNHESSSAPANSPDIGAPIYASDGQQFGSIKEVRGGYFKVDAPMSKDFWLSAAYIGVSDSQSVRLTITREQVDEHRLEAPGLESGSDAYVETQDAVISDKEALAQRERMERELAEQRARMGRQ